MELTNERCIIQLVVFFIGGWTRWIMIPVVNTIEFVQIATTGNSVDFGDLTWSEDTCD